ncbi:flagellar hook-associated protein FlgL [Clostridium tyrobutyricum]|uniref:flagellar hook-associated protein FlgL n=1 Tax=Clostridium tyrobutyricum TaxID=1519 RepID=UPI0018AA41E9|nr:flagellar hook-associated protein FlgL [Clostridium tyrobutyricum]
MRITNKMLANNFLSDMQLNLQNLSKIQQQMSSMKNFSKPSDDPFNVVRSMQLQTDINANKQYKTNITSALNFMNTTDTAFNQIGNVLSNVRDNLVKAGDAAYGTDERTKIADEVNQRVAQLAQQLNTSFQGDYIFAGTRGLSKPVMTIKDDAGNISIKYADENGNELVNQDVPVVQTSSMDLNNWKSTSITFGGDHSGTITLDSSHANVDNLVKDINTKIQENADLKDQIIASKTSDGNIKFLSVNSSDDVRIDNINSYKTESINNLDNWSGKSIVFNVNTDDNTNYSTNISLNTSHKNVDDLVKDINTKIQSNPNLQNKVAAIKTDDGNGNESIKFLSLDSSNDIKIDKSTTVVHDLSASGKLPAIDQDELSGKQFSSLEMDSLSSKRKMEVAQGVVVEYNANVSEVLQYGPNTEDNTAALLDRIVHHLNGQVKEGTDWVNKPDEATAELIGEDLSDMDLAAKQAIKVRSEIGSKSNRMEDLSDQNDDANINMTDILSKTEDIDITEKTIEYYTMTTVYQASLQTSAKVIQPTLMDYLS